ncbi:rRNA (guanine-N2)-methyltransferase [Treponema ruminis]|uniref:23S rRNA (Cytosine1962-C5)-methyltransferase n=1 Tax=Treponema ruminis TaxID=744515 RepID=A0A7W8G7B8_9SPIR|nr:class I SAM-dependent methyltransferase [Treponema ruminis]MBB5225174.1 23S rRNA (cytosine1962-C5)-methyltransferase [Treponema ruminis]QSI01956.1 rRNA (guanine-N2)-methyltransferase [Treponema ruminis]
MNQNTQEQNEYQAKIFANRLAKKYKQLRKWARRERVTCYRLYDRDIPEVPLAVDLYEFLPDGMDSKIDAAIFLKGEDARISANDLSAAKEKASRQYLHLYLYERPYEKSDSDEEIWLSEMRKAAAATLEIPESHVIQKLRKKQKGENQYEKIESERTVESYVQECGQLFKVNLSDYLDTGLFFDHRPLRSVVRSECAGKSVLNLFCYTGSFSVYAAEGNARRVESVDLSNTYLEWARFNFALNDFDPDSPKFFFTRGDVTGFLNQKLAEVPNADRSNRYDIIVLDPPTFSNSKATRNTLDINRDWSELVRKCVNLLNDGGVLYFSTNSHRLKFDADLVPKVTDSGKAVALFDMTEKSLPEDFKGTKAHRLWKIQIA